MVDIKTQSMHLKKKILFIHHSTGGNLIREGDLRKEIWKLNPEIEFWDHSYNLFPILSRFVANHSHNKGLSNAKGEVTGKDLKITLSNNSPKEYAEIFSRDVKDPTLKSILTFDVIAFKNCYPTTRITSDHQFNEDVRYYEIIRDSIQKYPEKQFVLITPPPERKQTTNFVNALRAKMLVSWLNSKIFLQETHNIYVFDLFSLLADQDGMLRKDYQRIPPWDSHPNCHANKIIAPILADFLVKLA
jgi:hypothetical protein